MVVAPGVRALRLAGAERQAQGDELSRGDVEDHRAGLIELPAAKRPRPTASRLVTTAASDAQPDRLCSLGDWADLKLTLVQRGPALRRWHEWVGRHHYLSYKMLAGAPLRYFIVDGEQVVGAMGFGAAAWQVAARDRCIGWTAQQRERGLHLIVGQSRFTRLLPELRCAQDG